MLCNTEENLFGTQFFFNNLLNAVTLAKNLYDNITST